MACFVALFLRIISVKNQEIILGREYWFLFIKLKYRLTSFFSCDEHIPTVIKK